MQTNRFGLWCIVTVSRHENYVEPIQKIIFGTRKSCLKPFLFWLCREGTTQQTGLELILKIILTNYLTEIQILFFVLWAVKHGAAKHFQPPQLSPPPRPQPHSSQNPKNNKPTSFSISIGAILTTSPSPVCTSIMHPHSTHVRPPFYNTKPSCSLH